MRRLNIARDAIPSAFAWKPPPGQVAGRKDSSLDKTKYKSKNKNNNHTDKVSGHNTNDTIMLTQTWEIQNTVQCTKESVTHSPPRQTTHSRKLPLSTRRLESLRAWNIALGGRQRLRRKARSKTATRYLERYLREKGTQTKPTETPYGPNDSSAQNQPLELVKQSQCSMDDDSGDTFQSKVPWSDRLAKIWTRFIYLVGFMILLGSCAGIGIIIYFCFSRGTIREILLSLLSLIMTNLRPMLKQYVDEIISSQRLSVQHSSVVSEHISGSDHNPVSEQNPVPEKNPVSEQNPVSGHASSSAEDETDPGVGPFRWKPFLIAASILTVVKTRYLSR